MHWRVPRRVQRAALVASIGAAWAVAAQPQSPDACAAGGLYDALPPAARAPPAVIGYLSTLGGQPIDFSALCAAWAGGASDAARPARPQRPSRQLPPVRLIFVPAESYDVSLAARLLERASGAVVPRAELAGFFGVAVFAGAVTAARVLRLLELPFIEYFEPDCDGPGFAMTASESLARARPAGADEPPCWRRGARTAFPNDPCLPELWGHRLIGWNGQLASAARPRLVAVLDTGINCAHEDLAANIWRGLSRGLRSGEAAAGGCSARSGRDFTGSGARGPGDCDAATGCNPHGTQMAGTIAGAIDNGMGLVGVAPRAQLMPVRISRVEHGSLAGLAAIARAILFAGGSGAHVINISAKWPVHSYVVYRAIRDVTAGRQGPQRFVVTGYVGSVGDDNRFHEAYPSRYRCLPGVIAAVPIAGSEQAPQMQDADVPPAAAEGRLAAPGVDIVVTTTENHTGAYGIAAAGGASSAAAYVSGSVALAWGTAPLHRCSAGDVERVMFCRGRRRGGISYPLVNVEFLGELSRIDPDASCAAALAALGCAP